MQNRVTGLNVSLEDALLQLATAQQELADAQKNVDAIKMRHKVELTTPLKDLETISARVSNLETAIISSEREYVLSTGEQDENGTFKARHPSLTIRRKPVSYIYDEKEMLKVIQARKGTGALAIRKKLIRTKTELNKVELNKVLGDSNYAWLPAEPAGRDVTVSIAPLGDLLIRAEMEAKSQAAAKPAEAQAAPTKEPIPDYVIGELQELAADGFDMRFQRRVLDQISMKAEKWLSANKDRYTEALNIAARQASSAKL